MTVPGKLTVDQATGKLKGAAKLEYNDPWPCANHGTGSGAMRGVIMHTEVGNNPGTIALFNNPRSEASAFFAIAQDGTIHQFLPVGKGFYSWAQKAGNLEWYSIEHADDGNTENPLTAEQITASAQLVECLSAFAGFPLQVTDSTTGRGYGTHVMGGAAWGGHTCPGPGPRARQRYTIIDVAQKIRAGVRPPFPSGRHTADGTSSLAALAVRQRCDVSDIIWATVAGMQAIGSTGFGPLQAKYLNAGDWAADMPAGMSLWLP